jgi:hypothetical protein
MGKGGHTAYAITAVIVASSDAAVRCALRAIGADTSVGRTAYS